MGILMRLTSDALIITDFWGKCNINMRDFLDVPFRKIAYVSSFFPFCGGSREPPQKGKKRANGAIGNIVY